MFGTNFWHMVRQYIILWVLVLSVSISAPAQNFKAPVSGVGIIYNREMALNLKVTTNRGIAPGIEFGRLRTYYKTTFFHVNVGDIRHPKEYRQSAAPTVSRSFRPYVFGKQNSLLALRAGWGTKRYYSEKARQKGVAVGMSYSFGPTLGVLKPYYLALKRIADQPSQSRVSHEKYSEANAQVFLNNSFIYGASPFTRGFSELSFLPGANAALALHLDWGAFDEFLKAMEIGIMADVFIRKAPILVAEEQNNRTFINFFLNLQFGKRR